MAQVIKTDGSRHAITPANGSDFKLAQLYAAIGCNMIEIVNTHDGRIMILDEEGKLTGRPVNVEATALYVHGAHDPIVGDVVVCNPSEVL